MGPTIGPADRRLLTGVRQVPPAPRRDPAEDLGELQRTRPHRPVARREVDVGHVVKLGQAGDPRVAFFDRACDLLRSHGCAHDRRWHVEGARRW